MKKIINGKSYDTETAKKVGEWVNTYNTSDHTYCSEELYQKRTGEFFIKGEGGAMSKYAKSCGNNSWSGSVEIIPLTYKAAQEWAEKYLSGEEYEAIFGEIVEDDNKSIISLSITVTSHNKLKRVASEQHISVSELVENLIHKLDN